MAALGNIEPFVSFVFACNPQASSGHSVVIGFCTVQDRATLVHVGITDLASLQQHIGSV